MSAITVGGDLVHYEVLGRGRPVILLHSWIGSWRYWIPIMRQLQLKYRVYAIDLFGFGDSSKNPAKYTVGHQVLLLDEFMKQLGVPKAAIIAHGLGALVLTQFADRYPDRVARMLMTNAPLFDTGDLDTRVPIMPPTQHTAPSGLRDNRPLASKGHAGSSHTEKTIARRPTGLDLLLSDEASTVDSPLPGADVTVPSADNATITNPNMIDRNKLREAAMARGTAYMRGEEDAFKAENPGKDTGPNPLRDTLQDDMQNLLARCFRRSEAEYDKLMVDVSKADDAILQHSARGFDSGWMLDTLRRLGMPIVIVHGEDDPIIPAPDEAVWNYLTLGKDDSLLPIPVPGVRHFPMLEHEPFARLVNSFLESSDIGRIEVKERWRRRTR